MLRPARALQQPPRPLIKAKKNSPMVIRNPNKGNNSVSKQLDGRVRMENDSIDEDSELSCNGRVAMRKWQRVG